MNRIILDTDALSVFFRGNNQKIQEFVKKADLIIISPIVLGEVLTGFRVGTKEAENRKLLRDFLTEGVTELLDISYKTAEIYSSIKALLRKKGQMVPTNDLWIAAQAIETKSVLVSLDEHFRHITDVHLWDT